MQKAKRNALIRFLLTVAAVVVGTAMLGSLTSGGDGRPSGKLEGRTIPGSVQTQHGAQTGAPADTQQ